MAYEDHFSLADDVIKHLETFVPKIEDPFLKSRYTGFVAISGATVYELAIKEIFISFAQRKHDVFGSFVSSHFERLNGRIKYCALKGEHIPRFGEKYVKKFEKNIQETQKQVLQNERIDILTAYNNLIQWRHQFVHNGKTPETATYEEVIQSYGVGKRVIHCLAKSMVR